MDRKTLNQASAFLRKQRLAKAIECMLPIMNDTAYASLHDRLNNIKREYEFMQEYMRRGIGDPARDRLYAKLLKRMHQVVSDADVVWLIKNDTYMADAMFRISNSDVNPDTIRRKLEDFISDVALSQFSDNENEADAVYQRHADYMELVFDFLLLSKQWSEGEANDYEALLISPTIDSNDAAHMVSAISLSCYTHFDIRKFRTLMAVYEKSQEMVVRQRALVGWALSLRGTPTLYPEMKTLVEKACENEDTLQQLLEMQMQMFFCLNAERDNDAIQRDILPTLMKHNNFEITRWGITEKEENPLEDILHPDAEEKAMEEMEKTFQRMTDMQKSGSDVYFGGFSQMKRIPFFYNWANWFCPFYIKHPALTTTMKKLGNMALLTNLLDNGPFCDSDKYSFAIAISSVVDKLPGEIKSMLGSEEVFGPVGPQTDIHSPSTVRLMYLQDLYRFFRLCDKRKPFRNPFGGQNGIKALFMAHPVLVGIIDEKCIARLGRFLLKHQRNDALTLLLESYDSLQGNADLLTLRATVLIREGKNELAIDCLRKAHRIAPDNIKTYAMLGRCLMMEEMFDEAMGIYSDLCERMPENKGYLLNQCIAMVNCGQGEKATTLLFKLNYDYPDDINVTRVLAWGLLSCGKIPQAEREYQRLLSSENPSAEDCLNAGYCKWITGEVEQALTLFRKYVKMVRESHGNHQEDIDMTEVFQRDSVMLMTNGLTSSALLIMADMVE